MSLSEGIKKPLICNEQLLVKVSALLQKVHILIGDYSGVVGFINGRSFVYLDPSYRPVSQTSNFTTYSPTGFDDLKQIRLSYFCRLIGSDSKWMMSNSNSVGDGFFKKYYADYTIRKVNAKRLIGASANSRGDVKELLITNY